MPRQSSTNLSTVGKGTYIYHLPKSDRYQAYVKFPAGYSKSAVFYDFEEAETFCRLMKEIPEPPQDVHWTEYINVN